MKPTARHQIVLRVLLGILLVIGGFQGLPITVRPILKHSGTQLFFVFLIFYAMNLVAAYYLWKKPRQGLIIACFLFCLQIPIVETPPLPPDAGPHSNYTALTYRLASASGVWIKSTPDGPKVDTNWASCFAFEHAVYRRTGWGPNFKEHTPADARPKHYGFNLSAAGLAAITLAALRWKRVPFYHAKDHTRIEPGDSEGEKLIAEQPV